MSEIYYAIKYFFCWVNCRWLNEHTVIDWYRDTNWTQRYGECIVCKERQIR